MSYLEVGAEWWWRYTATELLDSEKLNIQTLLLRNLLWMCYKESGSKEAQHLLHTVAALLDPRLREKVARGQLGLLPLLATLDLKVEQSQRAGYLYITILEHVGIDVGSCIMEELSAFPGWNIKHHVYPYGLEKRVIFERRESLRWDLRWEYVLIREDPAFFFLTELTGLTTDVPYIDTFE
jgi:hypothetical protein